MWKVMAEGGKGHFYPNASSSTVPLSPMCFVSVSGDYGMAATFLTFHH